MVNGVASMTVSNFGLGTHNIAANYPGDATHTPIEHFITVVLKLIARVGRIARWLMRPTRAMFPGSEMY